MRKFVYLAFVCLVVVSLTGCATITTGRHQKVPIDSNPQGANVKVSSGYNGVTPCSFDLQRNKEHIIEIAKQGYKTAKVIMKKTICGSTAGNAIVGGVIGLGVDAMSGAIYKLIPEEIIVDLVPGNENEVVIVGHKEINEKVKAKKKAEAAARKAIKRDK